MTKLSQGQANTGERVELLLRIWKILIKIGESRETTSLQDQEDGELSGPVIPTQIMKVYVHVQA